MEYTCQHCNSNLDEYDKLEATKARETAMLYGWTKINKLHFNRSITVQPENGLQYSIYMS